MKRFSVFVFALLLGASLSFAQTGGGTTGDKSKTAVGDKDKDKAKGVEKGHKGGKKGHKGGKKSKKGSTTTTPPPK